METIRTRKTRRYFYKCGCPNPVRVGPKYHARIVRGYTGIFCKVCKVHLSSNMLVSWVTLE